MKFHSNSWVPEQNRFRDHIPAGQAKGKARKRSGSKCVRFNSAVQQRYYLTPSTTFVWYDIKPEGPVLSLPESYAVLKQLLSFSKEECDALQ